MAKGNKKGGVFVGFIDVDNQKEKDCSSRDTLQSYADALINNNTFSFVATIIHDKAPKTIHMHFYIELVETTTISAFLTYLSTFLNINKNVITLDTTNNDFLMVQYLLHKNQPDKEPYKAEEIQTTNSALLEEKLNKEYKKPINEQIREDIMKFTTLTEVMNKYGIDLAKKYQPLFNQVKKEQKINYEDLKENLNILETRLNDLEDFTQRLLDTCDNGLDKHNKTIINLQEFKDKFNLLIEFHYKLK